MIDPTLFGHALRDEITAAAATFKTVERVVVDQRIKLGGQWFDAKDMFEILREVLIDGDVVVEQRMGDMLVNLKVLTTRGNRNSHAAQEGENFQLLYDILEKAIKR